MNVNVSCVHSMRPPVCGPQARAASPAQQRSVTQPGAACGLAAPPARRLPLTCYDIRHHAPSHSPRSRSGMLLTGASEPAGAGAAFWLAEQMEWIAG